ncbi:hypothetical protein SANTM175S_07467 [Streptomyces antimycoticus]
MLALFALTLIWGLMAAAAQLQCVDAARAGARAAALSEPRADAMAAARSAAPDGARVELWQGETWCGCGSGPMPSVPARWR